MKKIYLSFLFLLIAGSYSASFAQNCVDLTVQVTTTVQANPASITFTWAANPNATSYRVYRKTKAAGSWGAALVTLPANATTYTDNTVAVGTDYEYKVNCVAGNLSANTYLYCGIKYPQTENRHKIILLVDNTFSNSLAPEITRLVSDMVGDGWQVIRHDVMRNDTPPNIKALIQADYTADPQNVKAVFLFGHVPVPYSGDVNPDGHPDHLGAWPADGYYGDMTGNWSDVSVNDVAASRVENQNGVGDGKFDQNFLPFTIELQVGRVDLSNMPSFPSTEQQLLKQYLDKDHNFRHKVIDAQRRGLIDDNFGYFGGEAFASSGWRNFTSMFTPANITAGNIFTDDVNQSWLWSYGCGGGSYNSCSGVGVTSDYVNNAPQSVFNMLFGSYFGDWDAQDNFLRAPLASSGWGLTCSWSGRPYSVYHHMALGENIGYSALATMRNSGVYVYNYFAQGVTIGFMGDPTLRMHTIAPPTNVVATPSWPRINLSWTASADQVLGYCVYHQDTVTGVYSRINNAIISGTSYVDSFPLNHGNYYMVRAIKLETSNSGSYYNLSQGAFDTTQINVTGIADAYQYNTRFRMYPNPAADHADLDFYLADQSKVSIALFDMTGREVKTLVNASLPQGDHSYRLNTRDLSKGVYMCRFTVNNKTEYKKLVVSE